MMRIIGGEMAIISYEVEFIVEVQIVNSWYEKSEPTASLGHATRMAKALLAEGYELGNVRIVKHTDKKEVLDIDLT